MYRACATLIKSGKIPHLNSVSPQPFAPVRGRVTEGINFDAL